MIGESGDREPFMCYVGLKLLIGIGGLIPYHGYSDFDFLQIHL